MIGCKGGLVTLRCQMLLRRRASKLFLNLILSQRIKTTSAPSLSALCGAVRQARLES